MRILAALLFLPILLPAAQDPAQQAVEAERRGDFQTAVNGFTKALEAGDDSPQLRSNLGIAYFQLGENDRALEQFRMALARLPDFAPANLFAGLALLRLEQPRQALLYLQKAHAARTNAPEILLALARAELGSSHLARSNEFFNRAAHLDPNNAEAWFGLGITDRALAENALKNPASRAKAQSLLTASETAIKKGLAIDPDSVHVQMLFAESFRIAERYPDAIREYREVTAKRPQLAPAWAGLAAAYSASGDTTHAIEAARRSIALDPNDAESNVLLAGVYMRAGDYTQAQPYAERALALKPDLVSANLVLAKLYLAQQQPEKALPPLTRAAKDDNDGSANYLLATTLAKLGHKSESAAALKRYRELHERAIGLK